jgi:hypothetical protein
MLLPLWLEAPILAVLALEVVRVAVWEGRVMHF